jgi:hypothetical protein
VWRKVFNGLTAINFSRNGGGADITSPYSTSCSVTLNTDGTLTWGHNSNGAWSGLDASFANWVSPTLTGAGDNYWVRGTVTSGSPGMTSGTSGSWLALSSAQSWTFSRSTLGQTLGVYTLEVASDAAGANIVSTNALSINIENGPP